MNVWLLAIRPKTLWASVAPVMIGTAMAFGDGVGHALSAVAALCVALFIQIATNLANDYFDHKSGVDNNDRQGPVRVTQSGLITPAAVKLAFVMCFSLAGLIAIYLIARGGFPVLIIAVLSIASGLFYTAGPKPLSHLGLGDVFVLVFFGPVAVAGTYYVQALHFNATAAAAGLAPGLLSTAILAVNNLRDIATDLRAGKITLAVRFGPAFARAEYVFCVVAAGCVPFIIYRSTHRSLLLLFSSLVLCLTIPIIMTLYTTKDQQKLNAALAGTGMVLFIFSVIFSIGWLC